MSVVSQTHALIQSLFRLTLVALIGAGGYFGWHTWSGRAAAERELESARAEIKGLSDKVAAQGKEIERLTIENQRLTLANKLLKVDRRVARVVVLGQQPSKTAGRLTTRVRFEEVDGGGNPIGAPREFTIEGDLVYVDAQVVKFEDIYVERDDPLRAASACRFTRLFGEFQQPSEGFLLDAPGETPAAYDGRHENGELEKPERSELEKTERSELEKKVWSDFWQYANDPQKAHALGIRAAHGEAPSMKLKPGAVYTLTLRASGGLTIAPEKPDGGQN